METSINNKSSPWKTLTIVFCIEALLILCGIFSTHSVGSGFEGSLFNNLLSFTQLMTIALLSWRIFFRLKTNATTSFRKSSCLLWAIISLCFVFISLDEIFEIHIVIKDTILSFFSLKESALLSRLDDLVVALYGVAGCLILYNYRKELRLFKDANSFLYLAIVFFTFMILLDAFNARNDVIPLLVQNGGVSEIIHSVCIFLEEVLKYITEVFLIAFFYIVFRKVSSPSEINTSLRTNNWFIITTNN